MFLLPWLSGGAAWLWWRKLLEGHEFEAGLRYAMAGKLSLSAQQ